MKKYIKNNQSFVCVNCGKSIDPHPSSSRDHCNFCLYGLHVDINPGDRMNKCKGTLKPIGIRKKKNIEQIVFKCVKCNKTIFCKIAPDDNKDELSKLYSLSW